MTYLTNSTNIFILLVLFSFTMDIMLLKCFIPSIKMLLIKLLHHIISMYIWFGSFLFQEYKYHLMFLLTLVLFQYYKWKYNITLEYDKQCAYKTNKNSIFYKLNKKFESPYYYYFQIATVVIYDMYYIWNK